MLTDCELVAAALGDSFVWSDGSVSLTASGISVDNECLIVGGFTVLLDGAQVSVAVPCVWPDVSLSANDVNGNSVRLDAVEVGKSMLAGLAIILAGA